MYIKSNCEKIPEMQCIGGKRTYCNPDVSEEPELQIIIEISLKFAPEKVAIHARGRVSGGYLFTLHDFAFNIHIVQTST